MNKYIDAEKLITEIKRYKNKADNRLKIQGRTFAEEQKDLALQNLCGNLLHFIASHQKEQEQPEVQNGKFVFPKYLYARTKDNKTIDMSYAPQDMTAVEYVRNDFVQQEQPEGELKLEEEIKDKYSRDTSTLKTRSQYAKLARHFYGLRNRALEEAAQHVYESWMGGTMNDVRRDMVELGKVLNARK